MGQCDGGVMVGGGKGLLLLVVKDEGGEMEAIRRVQIGGKAGWASLMSHSLTFSVMLALRLGIQ